MAYGFGWFIIRNERVPKKRRGQLSFFFSLHLPFSPPSNVPFHRRPQAPVWRLYRPVGPSAQLFYCVRSTLVEASLLHTHVHHVHVYAYRRATRLMTCINRVNRLSSWRLCGTSSVVVYPVETRQKKPDVMAHQMFFFASIKCQLILIRTEQPMFTSKKIK